MSEAQVLTTADYFAGRIAFLEAEKLRIEGAIKELRNAQALLTRPAQPTEQTPPRSRRKQEG